MRSAFVLLVLGVAVVLSAVAADLSFRRGGSRRAEDIRLLRAELDSTRGALAVATNAADSVRLAASVADRTRLMASRLVHASGSSATSESQWSLSGPGAVFATLGAAIVVLAISLIVRGTRARK